MIERRHSMPDRPDILDGLEGTPYTAEHGWRLQPG
jgi:hypothetical protein